MIMLNGRRMRNGIAGLVCSVMLALPAALAADAPDELATEQALEATDNSPAGATQEPVREGRVVFVGPRQNVKMRIGVDPSPVLTGGEVERECKGRTYYVGPRHNIKRTFKKDCSDTS
ncbi:hypothetical protein [Hyphococcus sp.]|uniref:hypothetical protein n=1 Tax=Hyphococcus sp. TaxID=2038636 RepID=UPI0035C742F9